MNQRPNLPDPHPQRAELYELLEAFCRGDQSPEEHARMEQLVAGDEVLRREYVQYLHMHVCLRRAFEGADEAEQFERVPAEDRRNEAAALTPATVPLRMPAQSPWQRTGSMLACAAAAVLVALFVFNPFAGNKPAPLANVGQPPKKDSVKAAPPATLTRVLGCVWDGPNPLQRGALLTAGRYMLSAGIAEITFASGAVVLAEAPVELEVVDAARGFVHSGRVVARVPPRAIGFVIETRQANLVDLGTEFGVGVGNDGDTLVQVFDGLVVAEGKHGAAKESGQHRLVAGETLSFATDQAKPRSLESSPHRFVRRFPDPKQRGKDELVPHNVARFDTMHIVPAPRRDNAEPNTPAIKIDGDLSDWDLSGMFLSRCVEPYGENYYAAGAMMYDENYLYIAAHVGDPAPMASVIDPETDSEVGWKGGSIQVRISTNPALGWPLESECVYPGPHGRRPVDVHDQLVHLTMWHFAPKNQPCLNVAYGMNYHGKHTNPAGAIGTFRKDDDGLGYVMEYAIPWSELNAKARPLQAGDVTASCWNVHWSDEGGRVWQGYLIDVINPAAKGFTYQKAATWARTILHRQGQLRPGTVKPISP